MPRAPLLPTGVAHPVMLQVRVAFMAACSSVKSSSGSASGRCFQHPRGRSYSTPACCSTGLGDGPVHDGGPDILHTYRDVEDATLEHERTDPRVAIGIDDHSHHITASHAGPVRLAVQCADGPACRHAAGRGQV